ncbi:MAG: GntR family transcriptional regulator [Clostridia bacterium]|nr:GntR family transcriptional regulator [Clostridia bacterium]
MIVDKNSTVPAYRQLKEFLAQGILQKTWEGEIPSERQLSEMAGVTRMTVRQAVGELVNDGLLYRIKGKGTFVAKPKFEQHNIMSFSALLQSRGTSPRTRILWFDPYFTDMTDISPEWDGKDERFYRLRRIRCAGNDPVGIEEVFLPHSLCPGLEKHDLTGSLYEILFSYGHVVHGQDVRITARRPSEEEAGLFDIRRDTPLLEVCGNSLAEDRTPLFFERAAYLSDRFSYKVGILNRT